MDAHGQAQLVGQLQLGEEEITAASGGGRRGLLAVQRAIQPDFADAERPRRGPQRGLEAVQNAGSSVGGAERVDADGSSQTRPSDGGRRDDAIPVFLPGAAKMRLG